VRLKSYRRGQQDVEYLTLLQRVTGAPRFAIANTVRQTLKLSGNVEQADAEDAGRVNYGQIDPAALWSLRVRIGTMLDAAHPEPQRALVERHMRERR
jgi:hypothetical protein